MGSDNRPSRLRRLAGAAARVRHGSRRGFVSISRSPPACASADRCAPLGAPVASRCAYWELRIGDGFRLRPGGYSTSPWNILAANRTAADFCTAFAILARDRKCAATPVLPPRAWSISIRRRRLPAFRKQTSIRAEEGRLMVRRRRLHPDLAGADGYEHRPEDEPYVEGRLYSDGLARSAAGPAIGA